MEVYPWLALPALLLGARRIAYHHNGIFIELNKWVMVLLFIVPFKSKVINIAALVWQIPANILVILYGFHLLGMDAFSNFTEVWGTLVVLQIYGVLGLLLAYAIVFEVIAWIKNRR